MINGYTAVRVFTATKVYDRDRLGDHVTAWLAKNQSVEVLHTTVTQSSDAAFHCMAITLFLRAREA